MKPHRSQLAMKQTMNIFHWHRIRRIFLKSEFSVDSCQRFSINRRTSGGGICETISGRSSWDLGNGGGLSRSRWLFRRYLGSARLFLSLWFVWLDYPLVCMTSRFAKYQLVLCETRQFPVGNAWLGEGGRFSKRIVLSIVRFRAALLSVWFVCFGFIYR